MAVVDNLDFNGHHVLFTPEYSDVLLKRVREIYRNDILHSYPQLKLQRLIDLLEHTEYLFELYLKFLYHPNGNNNDNLSINTISQNDALNSFVIGCFYIYLIMPQSIQFQSKNKSYTIYTEIKTLYESQLNMTNVCLMVKNEVETILENNFAVSTADNSSIHNPYLNNLIINSRKRSYSVPSNQIEHSINTTTATSNNNNNNNTSNYNNSYYNESNRGIEEVGNNFRNLSIESDSEDSEDQNPYLWKAPNLEPNDQLKVAAFMSSSDLDKDTNDYELKLNKEIDNSILLSPPTYSPPPVPFQEPLSTPEKLEDSLDTTYNFQKVIKKRNQSLSSFVPLHSTIPSIFNPIYANNNDNDDDDDNSPNTDTDKDLSFTADRSLTHRKNSYHSVYMLDTDETSKNSKFYDESNGFIQSLDRLQKQSIITAPELFSLISDKNDSKKILLIDLRTDARFQYSHILANSIVHIDPHLLWDQTANLPIYEMEKLETILRSRNVPNLDLFERRDQFDYIVYYSDMKTFMKMKFDYHFAFFYLLITSKLKKLKCVPTSLLGGYEKWKKVITNYSKNYDINIADYLYRSQASDTATVNKSTKKSTTSPVKKQPFPPTTNNQWKPLEVPIRIRKRPPPPPPTLVPKSPEVVPKIPPRVQIDSSLVSREYPFFSVGHIDNYAPTIPFPSQSPALSITSNDTTTTPYNSVNREYYSQERRSLQVERKLDNIPLVSTTLAKRYALQKNKQVSNINNDKYNSATRGTTDNTNVIQRIYTIPTIEKNPNIYVSLSITGLRNLGNTCYINSMIQCLFATKEFRNLFISSIYKNFLKPNNTNLPQLSNGFYLLFKKMYLNGGCSVVPISFLKICNILRPDLKIPDDQQDTTEFLMLVLDKLHDELSNQDEVVNVYPNLMLYDENQLKVETKDYKKWFDKNVIGNGLSPIDDIFQGQIEHSLQCQRCGHSSFNYSTFYVLSLAIPKPSGSTFSKNKRVRLEDCLNMYTSDEILSGENAWECPHCCKITNDYKMMVEKSKITKQLIKEQSTVSSKNTLLSASPLSSSSSSSSFRKSGLFRFSRHHDRHSNSNRVHDTLKPSHKMSRSLSPFRVLGGNNSSINNHNGKSAPNSNYNNIGNNKKEETASLKLEKMAQKEEMKEIKEEMRQWKTKKLITVKTLNFISLPKTLIIHLSRFFYDLTKKNDTIITYPLILEIPTKNGRIVKYKLYGLVNHTGNLISGHYTSLVNKEVNHSLESNDQKWYYFDDEVVKEETNHGDLKKGITKISSNDVYVLFYERIE